MRVSLAKMVMAMVSVAVLSNVGWADTVPATFTASGNDGTSNGSNPLAASARFSVDSNGHLVVVVTNTSAAATTSNTDVLTGIFFDLQPQATLLTQPAPQGSAVLTGANDTLLNVNNTPTLPFVYASNGYLDVSGEWGFGQSSSGFGFTGSSNGSANDFSTHYGIESSGAAFSSNDVINPLKNYDYDTDHGLQGADFGLVSSTTTSVNGQQDYFVKSSITFTLNFNPALLSNLQVQNVHFAYGTSNAGEPDLTGTPTPSPAPLPSVAWAGLGLLSVVAVRRRFGVNCLT